MHLALPLPYTLRSASCPQRGEDRPSLSAMAAAERVEAHAIEAPLSLPPLPKPPPPLDPPPPLPKPPPPPPPPPLPPPPPPLPLPAAPALPMPLAFFVGASAAAEALVAAPPADNPPRVATWRLVSFPNVRAGPTCLNMQVDPKRHLPLYDHCRHSPSATPATTVKGAVALMSTPLEIYASRRG